MPNQRANRIVLYMILDQNKDRQSPYFVEKAMEGLKHTVEKFMLDFSDEKDSVIYLDTIGM